MPWETMSNPSSAETAAIEREFGKKAKFLIDENLEGDTTEILRRLGWNACNVSDLGLKGHDDKEVFAAAWREDRMLLTNDHDFLDDRHFPEHRNPGVIIIPDSKIESDIFINTLRIVIQIFGPLREAYRKSKIVISSDGTIRIIRRDHDCGAMTHQRYRLGRHGETYLWTDSND